MSLVAVAELPPVTLSTEERWQMHDAVRSYRIMLEGRCEELSKLMEYHGLRSNYSEDHDRKYAQCETVREGFLREVVELRKLGDRLLGIERLKPAA